MQKVPYTHPAFVTAFANTCYTKGYTDKQAGSLLDTYIKADLIQNNQVFRDSMVKELEKRAMVGNYLGSALGAGNTSQAPTVMLPSWMGGSHPRPAFNPTTQLPPITTGGVPVNKAFPTPTSGLPQSAPSPFTFRPANTTGVPPSITPPPVIPPTIKPPTSLGGLPGGAGGRIPRMKLPGILGGLGSAALAGSAVGGLTNLGILPDSTMGGAAVGGAGGATIGALGGLLKALATKGRSGISGVLNAPAKQLFGSALRGAAAPMGRAALKGGLLGSVFGGSAGGVQGLRTGDSFLGSYPSLLTSTGRPPWATQGSPTSGTGNAVAANPFGLPSDILNEVNGYGKGNNTTSTSAAGTPQAAVQNYKQQLTQLDQQINQLESSIPAANNPTTYAQRMQAQPQIDMLKRQRSELSNNITMLENQVGVDKGRMAEFSTQQGALANQGLNTAQGEYRNLQDRLGSNNWLMKLYNQMSGANEQMQRLQPRYDYYNNAVQDAQEVGKLAQ